MISWEDIATVQNIKATDRAFSLIESFDEDIGRELRARLQNLTILTPHVSHLLALHFLAAQHLPRRYLEIGVWRAGSAIVIAASCPSVDMVGIDIWEGAGGVTMAEAKRRIASSGHTGQLTLLLGDSRNLVSPQLGMFDLIFVDGCHSAEMMTMDLNNAAPLLRPGGRLVIHDVFAPQAPEGAAVWEAFKAKHPDWRWFEHRPTPGFGIGRSMA